MVIFFHSWEWELAMWTHVDKYSKSWEKNIVLFSSYIYLAVKITIVSTVYFEIEDFVLF